MFRGTGVRRIERRAAAKAAITIEGASGAIGSHALPEVSCA